MELGRWALSRSWLSRELKEDLTELSADQLLKTLFVSRSLWILVFHKHF